MTVVLAQAEVQLIESQEGALTLQLFQLFCDVLVKAPAMESVLAPVFARLIQVWPPLHQGFIRVAYAVCLRGLVCVAVASSLL